MRVVLFNTAGDCIAEKYDRIVRTMVGKEDSFLCRSIPAFFKRLVMPDRVDENVIAVFIARSKNHIERLIQKKDRLLTTRLVLVLPSDDQETIRLGHELKPRFLTFLDSGDHLIVSVLDTMIGHFKSDEMKKAAETAYRAGCAAGKALRG